MNVSAHVRAFCGLLACIVALLLGGCGVTYYSQAMWGEFSLLRAARPIPDWVADPDTPAELRARLALAAQIRRFASDELALPDNASYTRYADLHRSYAVWNVFAAPPTSLTLKTWCYPVFGCAGYRGYFDRAQADAYGAALSGEGMDVYVAPVPAFSTLGWFSDPILNTFIQWPEPELARLIFHELAHQVVYVHDDTRFNESFATAVEQAGLERWVQTRNDPGLRQTYDQYRTRRADMLALVAQARRSLERIYAGPMPENDRLAAKREVFDRLQADYRRTRDQRWGGFEGYDRFFGLPWNNARVAAMAAYQDDVPAFTALLAREQGDMGRFLRAVRALAERPAQERARTLEALVPEPRPVDSIGQSVARQASRAS
jgi:predicted aminopeptidase